MDTKNQQKLDPKLKEIYERVMGTQLQTPGGAPAAPQTAPAVPAAQPVTPAASFPQAAAPSQVPIAALQTPATQFVAQKTDPKQTGGPGVQSFSDKKRSKSKPMLFVFLGLVFFLTYALFWVRFFHISLPFLPK